MQLTQVKKLESRYILGTYARYDVLIERGSGATLIDRSNKRYLDLLAGIGVNALVVAISVPAALLAPILSDGNSLTATSLGIVSSGTFSSSSIGALITSDTCLRCSSWYRNAKVSMKQR